MKLYHFNFEPASYKFVESRYAIITSDSAPATTMTLPLTISPSTTVGSLRVGLTSPPHLQPPSSNCPSNSPVSIAAALPPQSSSPPTITSAVGSAPSRLTAQTDPGPTIPERTNTVQGSRRRKATTPGKLPAAALAMNGEGEDLVEQVCKRMKMEREPEANGDVNISPIPPIPSSSITRSQTAMVCSVNGLMEALKGQQHGAESTATTTTATTVTTATPKVTTAIMMDANSAKNFVTQLLAAAAAGQGRIEVGGTGTATAGATAAAPLSGEQALDMSMRPTVEAQHQLQAQMKTTELKLADLIQADQLQASAANGLDALRSALTAQLTGAVIPPPSAGVQHITIGLPSTSPQTTASIDIPKMDAEAAKHLTNTSHLVNISQLQALISALTGVKASQVPKDSLNEVISSQMLLQSSPSLVTSNASAPTTTPLVAAAVDGLSSGAISFSNAGLALASALAPPSTTNSLKGITLPTGEFIPVASLIPGQPAGLGSFALTSGGPPSSLASFVTSLGGTPVTPATPAIASSQHLASRPPPPPPPPQLSFDAALFATAAAAGSPLNIVAQAPPTPATPQLRTQGFSQTQSINNGTMTPVTVVPALPRSDTTSPHVAVQSLRETASCTSLEELSSACGAGGGGSGSGGGGAGTDTDTSVVAAEEAGTEGLLNTHLEVTTEDSGSPMSSAGARKSTSASGKASRRTSSGLGTRPHRQNFTALQNRILTDWYNSHHYKPYPSTEDTKMLAQKSELTYSQVKKWFANKRARTSNNGLPKPLPPTAPDTPSTASADTSAFVAAAVAAAAAANQSSLLPNGSAGVMMQPQQAQQAQTTAGTKTGSILVPSGLMIRPNGATLAAAALSAGGLTILAPRPPLSSSQPAVVTPSTTSVTTTAITSPKATPSVATEGTGIEVPSVSPSPNATVVEETQQPSTYPICSPSPAHLKKENMEDKVVKEEKDDEDEGKAKEAI
ncbi:Homeobox protein extradenticle [Echinococcus granulosus]|uniref:Homeobox protein extradenticle n=2 Tax=Echinococcus granulosus TaxID=6210 RepID=A0A068WMW8_ECHGR|nr:Homeobox protein extradenticle [Echinococcus granulosus]CDS18989.1 homeobox protein extradenticle [Echinococcus granulosus]